MSKNLFRVSNSYDYNSVIKNNYLRPLFICYINKNKNVSFYDKVSFKIQQMATQMNYCMFIIIEFGEFIDNTPKTIIQSKESLSPFYEAQLRGKCAGCIYGREGENGEGKLTSSSMDKFMYGIENATNDFNKKYSEFIDKCLAENEKKHDNYKNVENNNENVENGDEEEVEVEVEVEVEAEEDDDEGIEAQI